MKHMLIIIMILFASTISWIFIPEPVSVLDKNKNRQLSYLSKGSVSIPYVPRIRDLNRLKRHLKSVESRLIDTNKNKSNHVALPALISTKRLPYRIQNHGIVAGKETPACLLKDVKRNEWIYASEGEYISESKIRIQSIDPLTNNKESIVWIHDDIHNRLFGLDRKTVPGPDYSTTIRTIEGQEYQMLKGESCKSGTREFIVNNIGENFVEIQSVSLIDKTVRNYRLWINCHDDKNTYESIETHKE